MNFILNLLINNSRWELDESRDSGNVIHVNKDTFPVEIQKVKYGLLMLHAGGFEIMDQAYDTMAAVSKELAANTDLKFFACDCGRGKDWGKASVSDQLDDGNSSITVR